MSIFFVTLQLDKAISMEENEKDLEKIVAFSQAHQNTSDTNWLKGYDTDS